MHFCCSIFYSVFSRGDCIHTDVLIRKMVRRASLMAKKNSEQKLRKKAARLIKLVRRLKSENASLKISLLRRSNSQPFTVRIFPAKMIEPEVAKVPLYGIVKRPGVQIANATTVPLEYVPV